MLMEVALLLLVAHLSTILALPMDSPVVQVAMCPYGARVMRRPDGEPRKCLPHQSNLCLNALDDRADASTVCCWHNQVDYYCCTNVQFRQCPQYHNVSVVIHNNFIETPRPVKTFHFKKGIEKEVADFAVRTS